MPVGLTLSGGLDSSAVLAASKDFLRDPLQCYTSVYSRTLRGEEEWAQKAAAYAGTTAKAVEAHLDDWWATLIKIVGYLDGPGFSPAVYPLWAIMAQARNDKVPVLLEGQGADELLSGYLQYPAIETLAHLMAGRLPKFWASYRRMSQISSFAWSTGWLTRTAFPAIVNGFTRDRRLKLVHPDLVEAWLKLEPNSTISVAGDHYDPVYKALWRDHSQDILPSLLQYGDSISMAHGIESRLPFLDYRLVEWVFRDSPQLLKDGVTKLPVRSFLRSRQFHAIAERRDKQGYPTPISDWYREVGFKYIDELFSDKGAPIWDLMNICHTRNLISAVKNGTDRGMFHLYKIISTDLWLRELKTRSGTQRATTVAAAASA